MIEEAALTVLKVKLDSRAVGDLAQPHVQVLALPRLKEQNVVAVVELGQLVELA
jgi:hypothetical protein